MTVTAAPKLRRGATTLGVVSEVVPGVLVDGAYRVESIVGSGGMARVFAARDERSGRRVALKVLHAEADGESQARRVMREASAANRVRSEHVTRVIAVGTLDSGRPFIVMELLEGVDLSTWLQRRGTLSVEEAASFLVQACAGLEQAHAAGIVHRDLKPSNLFVTTRDDGSHLVKLMDFGISKLAGASGDDTLTTTQDVLGTPHYMAPEQILSSHDVDARADVWALGAILYRLLTGRSAFEGATAAAVLARIAMAPAPRLREARRDAPVELETLIRRALDKRAARRLPSAAAFGEVLLPFAAAETQRRWRERGGADGRPRIAGRGQKVLGRVTSRRIGGALLLLAFLSVGWFRFRTPDSRRAVASSRHGVAQVAPALSAGSSELPPREERAVSGATADRAVGPSADPFGTASAASAGGSDRTGEAPRDPSRRRDAGRASEAARNPVTPVQESPPGRATAGAPAPDAGKRAKAKAPPERATAISRTSLAPTPSANPPLVPTPAKPRDPYGDRI